MQEHAWMTLACRAAVAACIALVSVKAEATTTHEAAARHLTDISKPSVIHLDVYARGTSTFSGEGGVPTAPWFEGFLSGTGVWAAATIGHPIRRMLAHLREEGVELEEAVWWTKGEGKPADGFTSYRRGYQLVDNYLVRVLAGKSAWDLPPGGLGKNDLQAARVALGKFEVLLRADCLATDLPLLDPYLAGEDPPADILSIISDVQTSQDAEALFLPLGPERSALLRANRWDLQLWDFAHELVSSRSTSAESYLCGSSSASKAQRMPGAGKRAVVYNSPSYHLTGVAMFSCVLMSLGFNVTAVIKSPGEGFEDLLPCPDRVITLDGNYRTDVEGEILNPEVSVALGLPPWTVEETSAAEATQGEGHDRRRRRQRRRLDSRRLWKEEAEGDERGAELSLDTGRSEGAGGQGRGDSGTGVGVGETAFDLSVLCTVVSDVNHLMKPTYSVDQRLVDALLWNVGVSIWNMHSVEGGFRHDRRMPSTVNDFVRGVPSVVGGRSPPPTFLTLYGDHVEHWERWSEEAYEGWGWDTDGPRAAGVASRGNSTFGGLFRRAGVVFPIHPAGHLRLPRPKSPFKEESHDSGSGGGGDDGRVTFVVQGNMQSYRRDYKLLMRCLENMCATGRDNYSLVAVGARGEMPSDGDDEPCVESRMTEWRHLGFPEFYANISAGHFVVTAAAGHDYEFDRATSTVPTALLLERPLVMSSTLLDAYPCLKKSRVHSMVADDDLCRNLEAAYDLTPSEYNEMELEARDCKLEMWRHARDTVAGMASGWALD